MESDICVLGTGITGLSTAFHLQEAGLQSICLVHLDRFQKASRNLPGMSIALPEDLITRTLQSFGEAEAFDTLRFALESHHSLTELVSSEGIRHERANCQRWPVDKLEQRELSQALQAVLSKKIPGFSKEGNSLHYLDGALFFEPQDILQAVSRQVQQAKARIIRETVLAIEPIGSGVEVHLKDQDPIFCEIAVLTEHQAISEWLPALSDVLIPYSDQWCSWKMKETRMQADLKGHYMTRHGLLWWALGLGTVFAGGARYLRKSAGIGARAPTYERKIEDHLKSHLKSVWGIQLGNPSQQAAFEGCRPCDETPLIGPMYGEDRILLATGFMNRDWSHGWLAGKCLAELLVHGQSKALPSRWWPRRLRSLSTH